MFGKKCVVDGFCYELDLNNYYCDGENVCCLKGYVCEDGKCVFIILRFLLMGIKLIGIVIIVFVLVVLVIFIIYCFYKRDKKWICDWVFVM